MNTTLIQHQIDEIKAELEAIINKTDGPIIDLWPSNDPEKLGSTHNTVDGKIELDRGRCGVAPGCYLFEA